jgi:hypothetical protein
MVMHMANIGELSTKKKQLLDEVNQCFGNIPPELLRNYMVTSTQLSVMEMFSFFIRTAPETMNPQLIKDHYKEVSNYIQIMALKTEKSENIRLMWDRFIETYIPTNVSDYKNSLMKLLTDVLSSWN